tara:strand:- start:3225 stop:3572 length:348 start_codon:yes stop_codon:yes gene_type:complete
MKKLLVALSVLSMLGTSVSAEARDNRDRNHSSSRHNNNNRGGVSTGEAIAIIGGAVILGAILGNNGSRSNDSRDSRYYDPNYRYEGSQYSRVCFEEQIVEYYNGRRYIRYEYRCR